MTSPPTSSHPTLDAFWSRPPIHNSWLRHCVPLITNEQSATASLAVAKAYTRQLLNITSFLSYERDK